MAKSKHNTTGKGTHRERLRKAKINTPRNEAKERRHSEVENAREDLHKQRKVARAKAAKEKLKITATPIAVPRQTAS